MKSIRRFFPLAILVAILLLGGILRFYRLGEVPPGLTDDEVNMAYDAISLLKTGKDQWNQAYPIFSFKGFGDYRSPVYTYLLMPLYPLLGATQEWVKVPSALFGLATIAILWGVAGKLGLDKKASLFAAFLLAINPWHWGMSRAAMVIVPAVFFFSLAILLLLTARKRIGFIVLSACFFALTIYCYPAYFAVTPLCMAVLGFLMLYRRQLSPFMAIVGLTVFFSISGPYLLASRSTAAGIRMGQVNILKDTGTVDVLNEKLGACQRQYPRPVCKLAFNRVSAFGYAFVVNYIRHFSPDLLFANGTVTQFSILPKRGLLLGIEYGLFVVGVFALLLSRKKGILFFLLSVVLISAIPDSLTGDGHYGRFFVVLPFIQLIAGFGFMQVTQVLGKFAAYPLILLLIGDTLLFSVEYHSYYPWAYSRFSHYGYGELSRRLETVKDSYDAVYVSSRVNDSKQYIYYLFYTGYDPAAYQNDPTRERVVESNGWVRVKNIGNIHFVAAFPETETLLKGEENVLYVGAVSEFPKTYIPPVFVVRDMRGDILFMAVRLSDWKRCLEESCAPGAVQ